MLLSCCFCGELETHVAIHALTCSGRKVVPARNADDETYVLAVSYPGNPVIVAQCSNSSFLGATIRKFVGVCQKQGVAADIPIDSWARCECIVTQAVFPSAFSG